MQAVQQHVILSAAHGARERTARTDVAALERSDNVAETFVDTSIATLSPAAQARLQRGGAALAMTGSRVGASLARLPARAVDALLWLYQKLVSPALQVAAPSCGCRFAPTCSHYAREALREHGLLAGLALTTRRLAKCGPWHPGGIDPVPPSPRLRRTGPPQKLACTRVRTAA